MNNKVSSKILKVFAGGLMVSFSALLAGPEAMLRAALLGWGTLGALAVLEHFQCRKWWQYLAGGALGGCLAGSVIYLLEVLLFQALDFGWYDWEMPVEITFYAAIGYGAVMLWNYNLLRHRNTPMRWFGLACAAWLVNCAAWLPIFLVRPSITFYVVILYTTAVFYSFLWLYGAANIANENIVPQLNKKRFAVMLILVSAVPGLLLYPLYTNLGIEWIRSMHSDRQLRQELLDGYIVSKDDEYDLVPEKFETVPRNTAEAKTEDERILEMIGNPAGSNRGIIVYAYSTDKKYAAVIIVKRTLFYYEEFLIIFRNDRKSSRGLLLKILDD